MMADCVLQPNLPRLKDLEFTARTIRWKKTPFAGDCGMREDENIGIASAFHQPQKIRRIALFVEQGVCYWISTKYKAINAVGSLRGVQGHVNKTVSIVH